MTTRQSLMARLIDVQNERAFRGNAQDIVTFSAFLNDAELEAHVIRYEEYEAKVAAR